MTQNDTILLSSDDSTHLEIHIGCCTQSSPTQPQQVHPIPKRPINLIMNQIIFWPNHHSNLKPVHLKYPVKTLSVLIESSTKIR